MKRKKSVTPRAVASLRERVKMLNERVTELERAVGFLQTHYIQEPVTSEVDIIDQELLEV